MRLVDVESTRPRGEIMTKSFPGEQGTVLRRRVNQYRRLQHRRDSAFTGPVDLRSQSPHERRSFSIQSGSRAVYSRTATPRQNPLRAAALSAICRASDEAIRKSTLPVPGQNFKNFSRLSKINAALARFRQSRIAWPLESVQMPARRPGLTTDRIHAWMAGTGPP